ncbi:MAG: hypothetical protein JWR67_2710 [Mucilaginibacter sp.]|nr:hypothetical protein [Mucilaginibacter sp.]MDB5111596.1 hypothetical protein [Mucilaginibacter sp.]
MKRILIIDNDSAILEIMQEALCYAGFDVKAIEETNNIFNLISDYQPDIVLIDYILNGINGGELCHQLKKEYCFLPVIIISAHSKVFLSLGNYSCDDFLAKPFNLSDLISRVNSQLQLKNQTSIN